jgi:DNA-binding NarL/FixJ family response regulator
MAERRAPAASASAAAGAARLLIVDDHPIVRQGVVRLIESEPDLQVCAEAESAQEAIAALAQHTPDLVLLDLTLRGTPGLDLIRQMRAEQPKTPVLVLSMHDETPWAERVLRAGACGFVMKQEKPRVLIARIRQALAGDLALSERMAGRLVRKFTGHSESGPAETGESQADLSDREAEVLQLIAQAMSTREIAASMHISVKTVEAHRENLKRKLDLSSTTELLRYAVLRFIDH